MRSPSGRRAPAIVLVATALLGGLVASADARPRPKPKRPNLSVSAVGSPRTATAGASLRLTATVRNGGTAAAGASRLRFYLSVDRRLGRGDVALAPTVVVRALRVRKSAKPSLRLRLPKRAPAGRRYVIACADALRRVHESRESDNCRATARVMILAGGALKPPAVPKGAPTGFAASTAFLYRGPNAPQTGVTKPPSAKRVAVIRGRVVSRTGAPLQGVRVSAVGRPELGSTATRADGVFEFAADGGGTIDLDLRKGGYLPAQRDAATPWHDYEPIPDTVLIPVDAAVTAIHARASGWQAHRAAAGGDGDGTRRPTLLFAPGTVATMQLPGGKTSQPKTFHVRATEYTRGASGPAAMPGDLPAQSGYTFAVEYSLDEAIDTGATGVRFDRAVIAYTEDFLGFPAGQHVPAGAYDRVDARWEAEQDGRVVKILTVGGGTVTLDGNGDDAADTPTQLAALGVTAAERAQLARFYHAGQVLWRVPLRHFSAQDYNWPVGPPADAVAPNGDAPQGDPSCPVCGAPGSQIQVERQLLGESIAIPGTPYHLVYTSDRVPGRAAARAFTMRITGPSVPASLTGIDMEIEVAGRRFTSQYAPTPNRVVEFRWDGKDAYGRLLQGWQTATVRVGFTYDGQYYATPAEKDRAFGRFSGLDITPGPQGVRQGKRRASGTITIRARVPVTIWREWKTRLGAWDARGQGLGGWTLDAQHVYDSDARLLLRGDGQQVSADVAAVTGIDAFAGGHVGFGGDGGPADKAGVYAPRGIAAAPDGSVYIATPYGVRRVAPDGTISTVYSPNGSRPSDVAVGPDGRVYIADQYRYVILRYDPRTRRTVRIAGDGRQGFQGDGGPAVNASLGGMWHLAVGPDGTVYVMTVFVEVPGQGLVARVRAIAPDGTIDNAIGGGPPPPPGNLRGDGLPATEVRMGSVSNCLAVGPDGSVYVSDYDGGGFFIRRIGPDGKSSVFAGGGLGAGNGDGGPATSASFRTIEAIAVSADGAMYVGDYGAVRRIDADGTIQTIAGDGTTNAASGDGGPAGAAAIGRVGGITLGPDGSLFISDYTGYGRVRAVRAVLPGSTNTDTVLPSSDGSEVYRFDRTGRHLVTFDGLTGAPKATLAYDAAGRLATIKDADGLITRIERNGAGAPTAIVAPTGQRTSLATDPRGFLSQVTLPDGATTRLGSTLDGLLTSFTDARGAVHRFGYDTLGRLIADTDPNGDTTHLARTTSADGWQVERTTPTGLHLRYRIGLLGDGTVVHQVEQATGGVTELVSTPDGQTVVTTPEGRRITVEQAPDARFGLTAPITSSLTVHEPSGLEQVTTRTSTVSLRQLADPLSIKTLTETATVNGRRSTAVYTGPTRTMVATSPAGRKRSWTWDARGHLVQELPSEGIAPIVTTWDAGGRITKIAQGTRSTTYTYDGRDRPATATDATGRVVRYAYDAADRTTRITTPGGDAVSFAYDANGDPTTVTLPGGATHRLTWDALGQLTGYTAPGAAAQTYASDGDRRPDRVTLPGGATIDLTYDASGRASGSTAPGDVDAVAYAGASQLPATSTRTRGGDVQRTAFSFDGDLPTRLDVTGPATGDIRLTWGADLDVTAWSLDGVASAIGRDADGQSTTDGPWTITRNAQTGLATSVANGQATVATGYDDLGRIASRTLTVAGVQVARIAWTYDAADRVHTRTDTPGPVGTAAQTRTYAYDADGRLTGVSGASSEAYAYDARGNRTSGPTGAAAYDLQDRLTSLAGAPWTSDAAGFVTGHGTTSLTYGARGDLRSATVGASTATYAYDSLGRRTARTEGGQTTQYLYGSLDDRLQLTASKAGGATTIYRYDDAGRLVALERGGARYVVASDQVGSPVAVADATTGAVVLRRTYDAFGRVTAQTGAFVLPIGFAGGLDDPTTGLVRFGARDYDPAVGRFLARDPALFSGGQWNLFAYADSDPVGGRDPSGLKVQVCRHGAAGVGPNWKPVTHWWIQTGSKSLGIGPGGPLGIENVQWTDQTYKWQLYGKDNITCEDQKDIDEACVNRSIYQGKEEGFYVPGANDCQTNVTAVLESCRSTPIKPR